MIRALAVWGAVLLATSAAVCGATPSASAQTAAPAVEPRPVEGGGDPGSAPLLGDGLYLDLLRQPETLWYRVDAESGQAVEVVAVLRGRPDGPASDGAVLRIEVLDADRQPAGDAVDGRFDGRRDVRLELDSGALPGASDAQVGAYLTTTLADPSGAVDLAELGYQLEFRVLVTGDALAGGTDAVASDEPARSSPPPSEAGAPSAAPVGVGAPGAAPPRGSTARDVLPIVLVTFAVGGAVGFELGRNRW